MLKGFYTIALFLFISSFAVAQSGTIKGTLKDETTGDAIIGASVVIEGTTTGGTSDVEGNFTLPKVKVGKYNLVISYIAYKTKTITGVEVYPDQTTVINTLIQEDVQQLEGVVITAQRQTNTDISVITELKNSDLVAVGISSQMIQMSQDRDASQIIRRVPGVTIIGNRFVNVRGLSERYNTVMLNGIIAPSTEVDSKAFALDLVPSNLIDRMLVYKSGAADLPGEFAGADINIFTKNIVDENSTSISVSGGFRSGTTGKDFQLSQNKGKTDWLGIDDGSRALPSSFPTQNLRILAQNPTDQNIVALKNATTSLPNTWGTRSFTASPDFRMNFDLARSMRLGKRRFDNITSISYALTNQLTKIQQYYYDAFDVNTQKSDPRYEYNDIRYSQVTRLGAISNFTFEFNPSHQLQFRNFYNQQSQNQSTFRTGTEFIQGFDVKNQAFNYYNRSIYSGQLSGKHAFSDALTFNWILGYNNTNADQPDYRRIRSQRSKGTTDDFAIVIPPGANSFDAGRFYSKLNESTYTAVGNLEIKLNPSADENKQAKIITGYYLEQKKRSFDARWMSYKWLNLAAVDNSMLYRPFSEIFTAETLGTKFILEEGTNEGPSLYDKYDGTNQLIAGHAGIVAPLGDDFRLSAGIRVEHNVQKIDVYNADKQKVPSVNSPLTVPMPFFNLSYNFTEKMLMRIAYSKTVNRPVFRELAPFNYYDFDRNADVIGNPTLKTAKIDNLDLRWELYPSKSENISLGVFYKHFKDPIEQYLSQGSNLIYSFLNADYANNYGVEAEARKSFEGLTSSRIINRLTLVFNGALIKSTIKLPDAMVDLESKRAMQGQSPYILNGSLFYNDADRGWQVSLMYNVFGKRIYAVGNSQNANQYELQRHQIDFTLTKQITNKLSVKLGIQDILNQKYRLIQDSNNDGKITSVDEKIQTYRLGQYSTLGVTWQF